MGLLDEALRINPGFVPATELHKPGEVSRILQREKTCCIRAAFSKPSVISGGRQAREANPEPHYSLGVIFKNQRQLPEAVKN